MKVFMKDLPKKEQVMVRSALKGNGIKTKDVIIHTNGKTIVIELKATGDLVKIN